MVSGSLSGHGTALDAHEARAEIVYMIYEHSHLLQLANLGGDSQTISEKVS